MLNFLKFVKIKNESAEVRSGLDRLERILDCNRRPYLTAAGVNVTFDGAMSVPAFGAAVTFLTNTIASLPLHLYTKRNGESRKQSGSSLYNLLHSQVNEELSSFEWRKISVTHMLVYGRWLTYIERDQRGRPINLFPLDPSRTVKKASGFSFTYEYRSGDNSTKTYYASDVIDIAWDLGPDMITAYGPYAKLKPVLGHAIASRDYATSYFKNGGVPPLQLEGPFSTPAGQDRAKKDLAKLLNRVSGSFGGESEGPAVAVVPTGHKLSSVGFSPEQGQLIEAQRFLVEEIARGFGLPPVFLQDLSKATFSNNEQQDLHLVKHTLRGLLEAIEAQINLKFFPRSNKNQYVEFNLDGLLRGDFKSRMEGLRSAVNTGIMTVDEARSLENRTGVKGGDRPLVQGAMVPLDMAGAHLSHRNEKEGVATDGEA